MKATYIYGAGDVRVIDVPDASLKGPGDAVVRTIRACICGSDLHPYHSMPASSAGRPIGHEFIGRVEAVGADVRTVKPGDFVISPFSISCGHCEFCLAGLHTSCLTLEWHGEPGGGACQAEALRVPQADGTLVPVPGVEDDSPLLGSLLTLSDVYLTGWHAALKGGVGEGSTVAVIGDGAVGLGAVLASKEMGAERIILMGRHDARVALGREFGATDVVAERGEEGAERVRELTGGGAPIVLEAVGLLPAYEQAIGAVRAGGTISRVGVPQYEQGPMQGNLFGRNVTLTGGVAPVRAYIERALPRVLSGAINPGKVFDLTVGLDDVPAGYQAMDKREALKVMIDPSL